MITLAMILAFLLLTSLLALGSGWNNVLSADRNALVFDGRNQRYGAYKIRQEHHRTVLIAMAISLALLCIGLFLPKLLSAPVEVLLKPRVQIVDVVFNPVEPSLPKPVQPALPAQVLPPSGPTLPGGIPVVVDTLAPMPKDSLPTGTLPGTGPAAGDAGPNVVIPGGGADLGGGGEPMDGYMAETSPEFPGGERALYDYLGDEVDYPRTDVTAGNEGRVIVGFVVLEDGTVAEAKVLRGVSTTLDAEALRVVRAMPKWKPGKFRGKAVKVRFNLPIMFKLAN